MMQVLHQLLPSLTNMFPKALIARNWAGCVFPWLLRHMATRAEKQTSHPPVWPLHGLVVCVSLPKSKVNSDLYGRLSLICMVCGKRHFGKKPAPTYCFSVVYAFMFGTVDSF
eukprot:Em0004g597a